MKLCRENCDLKSGCGNKQLNISSIAIVITVCLWEMNTPMIAKARSNLVVSP